MHPPTAWSSRASSAPQSRGQVMGGWRLRRCGCLSGDRRCCDSGRLGTRRLGGMSGGSAERRRPSPCERAVVLLICGAFEQHGARARRARDLPSSCGVACGASAWPGLPWPNGLLGPASRVARRVRIGDEAIAGRRYGTLSTRAAGRDALEPAIHGPATGLFVSTIGLRRRALGFRCGTPPETV